MCGIAGVVSLNRSAAPTVTQLSAMCAALQHRGPDEEGIDVQENVGLGTRRLSIIDPEQGHQPLFNEDRTVRVVFNGEIYNYRELAKDLACRGHHIPTSTDGEVISHLWEEQGANFLNFFNGMFAIALHDSKKKRFVLARDRLGIKPLFYAVTNDFIIFGSEIKALLATNLVERKLDLDALGQFLAWEYVPAPGTLLQGVRKLDAAEIMLVDLATGAIEVRPWWDVSPPQGSAARSDLPQTDGEWEEAIDAKLRECVRRQLVSDVPLGAFLSGGVDSSLVVSSMPAASTFSIGFDDDSYNELGWARAVADHLQVQNRVEVIQPQVIDLFTHLMEFMDDPIGDVSIFPTYLVSRLAAQAVKVVLTGDGGDELFGGYETFMAEQRSHLWERIPSLITTGVMEPLAISLPPRPQKKGLVNKTRHFVKGLQYDPRLHHARWRLFADDALRRQLFSPEAEQMMVTPTAEHILRLFKKAGDRSAIDRCLYVDMKSYLVDNCLVKVDRMSMACSLEARVPFLDHELVDLAFSVPARLKIKQGKTKVLLKKIAERHVPRRAVYRPKEGFSVPMKIWLNGQFRALMEELLSERRLAQQGIFQPQTVECIKREHLKGRENHSHVLWPMMVFQDWCERWKV